MELSHEQVLDPFRGYSRKDCLIRNPRVQESVKEIAQMDGAFVVGGDGLVHGAGIIGAGDDLFHGLAVPFGPGNQLVAVVDIGLVVQVMVILERLFRHAEIGKRVMGIGKIGKFESHLGPPLLA